MCYQCLPTPVLSTCFCRPLSDTLRNHGRGHGQRFFLFLLCVCVLFFVVVVVVVVVVLGGGQDHTARFSLPATNVTDFLCES